MKLIPYVDVLIRDSETDNDFRVTHSYPFPSINITNRTLSELREAFKKMKDPIWHPDNFLQVTIKEWKYKI
jgi:hypothetical protein